MMSLLIITAVLLSTVIFKPKPVPVRVRRRQ